MNNILKYAFEKVGIPTEPQKTKSKELGELDERELPNDYPVFFDYFYVVDGKPVRSPIQGKIKDLKKELGVKVINRCDIVGRNLHKK